MKRGEPEKKIETSEACNGEGGRKPLKAGASGSNVTGTKQQTGPGQPELIERMLERGNMLRALHAVEANRGAAGIDGVEVEQLRGYVRAHWATIKGQLLKGEYQPKEVLRVDIPKPGGGMRMLGIPTVIDRMIQQAMHQILSPIWEGEFVESSYGFRPRRSAAQAIKAAQSHVNSGRRWVVDMDLEKFFDRVNHDVLMGLIQKQIKDRRMLKLIGSYLKSGIMVEGIKQDRTEGTPQGGPLSPLLSNILLHELDKELEKRKHRYCRYADDCNIYVGSRRAGQRVMTSITSYLGSRLKLKVNASKSAVERPWKRKFLGFSLTLEKQSRIRVAAQSVKRFKHEVRTQLRKGRGETIVTTLKNLAPKLRGWAGYFSAAQTRGVFEELDQWIRRKLRSNQWRKWKRPRTRYKRLRALGLSESKARQSAYNGRGPWWNAGASHMNAALPTSYFGKLGLISLLEEVNWRTLMRQLSPS